MSYANVPWYFVYTVYTTRLYSYNIIENERKKIAKYKKPFHPFSATNGSITS